jgi:hypothetical protein
MPLPTPANPDCPPFPKNLIYTVVMDAPGAEGQRFLGRMLVSSLLRTFFTGDIVVFRNGENPLFLVERKGLEEVQVETTPILGHEGAEEAWRWKYRVAEQLDVTGYDKVMFLDADCLALRNIDHLLEGDWDIAYQTQRGERGDGAMFNGFLTDAEMARAAAQDGVNSGSFAVRAELFHEVIREWQRIDEGEMVRPESGFRDQASWNALLLREQEGKGFRLKDSGEDKAPRHPLKIAPFPAGEIQFPLYLDPRFLSYSQAALTHNCGGNTLQKIEFTFGLYMRTFFCDPTGLFFSILEM